MRPSKAAQLALRGLVLFRGFPRVEVGLVLDPRWTAANLQEHRRQGKTFAIGDFGAVSDLRVPGPGAAQSIVNCALLFPRSLHLPVRACFWAKDSRSSVSPSRIAGPDSARASHFPTFLLLDSASSLSSGRTVAVRKFNRGSERE